MSRANTRNRILGNPNERQVALLGSRQNLATRMESLRNRSAFPECKIQATNDLEVFLAECRRNYGILGVVDLDQSLSGSLTQDLLSLHALNCEGLEFGLIGVTSDSRRLPTPWLFQTGFQSVLPIAQLSKIGGLAERYWQSLHWPQQNVVDSVISNLPWATFE